MQRSTIQKSPKLIQTVNKIDKYILYGIESKASKLNNGYVYGYNFIRQK